MKYLLFILFVFNFVFAGDEEALSLNTRARHADVYVTEDLKQAALSALRTVHTHSNILGTIDSDLRDYFLPIYTEDFSSYFLKSAGIQEFMVVLGAAKILAPEPKNPITYTGNGVADKSGKEFYLGVDITGNNVELWGVCSQIGIATQNMFSCILSAESSGSAESYATEYSRETVHTLASLNRDISRFADDGGNRLAKLLRLESDKFDDAGFLVTDLEKELGFQANFLTAEMFQMLRIGDKLDDGFLVVDHSNALGGPNADKLDDDFVLVDVNTSTGKGN